jgi:hypothetical protein
MSRTKPSSGPGLEVSRTVITILDRRASFPDSETIAAAHGGGLATLKEFIIALRDDPSLFETSTGDFFWLGDRPWLEIDGYCRIDYEAGRLIPVSEEEWGRLPPQDRGYADKGTGPLALRPYCGRGHWWLGVSADVCPGNGGRVAYVSLTEGLRESAGANSGPITLRDS